MNPEGAPFLRDVTASLVWFAMDGGLRLAWHVELEPEGLPQFYDVLIDAETGELLLRRNRVLDAQRQRQGRAVNGDSGTRPAAARSDARRSRRLPAADESRGPRSHGALQGSSERSWRHRPTVRQQRPRLPRQHARPKARSAHSTGRDGCSTFPSILPGSAETALFFALNFAHDFFYDLGFDEAAGNFQVNNFGRGGLGGDPIKGVARAAGRNNATFQPKPEGTSPIISMFLWDGTNCWSEDVDGDGVARYRRRLRYRHRPARVPSRRQPPPEYRVQRRRGGRNWRRWRRLLCLLDQRRHEPGRLRVPGRPAAQSTARPTTTGRASLGFFCEVARQRRDLGQRAVGPARAVPARSRPRQRGGRHQ